MLRFIAAVALAVLAVSAAPGPTLAQSDPSPAAPFDAGSQLRTELRAELARRGDMGETVLLMREFNPEAYKRFEDEMIRLIVIEDHAGARRLGGRLYDLTAAQASWAPDEAVREFQSASRGALELISRRKPSACSIFAISFGLSAGDDALPDDPAITRFRAARRALFMGGRDRPVERVYDPAVTRRLDAVLRERGTDFGTIIDQLRRDSTLPQAEQCRVAAQLLEAVEALGPETAGLWAARK